MANCDKFINQAINVSCGTPVLISGLEDIAVLINRDDIDFSTIDMSSSPMAALAAIPFKSGKKGYMVKQIMDSFKGTKSELQKARFRATRKNTFAFVLFDDLGLPVSGTTGVSVIALTNGGTGYLLNDIITIGGGTIGNQARIKVTGVAGTVVTTWSYVTAGSGYAVLAGVACPVSTGTGSGFVCAITTLTAATVPPATNVLMNQIDNGRFVAIYKKRTGNAAGDISYKIMGLHRGLKAAKGDIDYFDEETAGAVPYILEEENVPEAPLTFASTSKALTEAAFNALCDMY